MASKSKKPRVAKARKAIQEPQKSEPLPKPVSVEALVRRNGELVESLFASDGWKEIAFPLLEESIASVSGRFTNGRFHQGTFTRTKENRDYLSGYQAALEEFYNRLHDFVAHKDIFKTGKKREEAEQKAPLYNPFMEDHDGED